jgi:autotransporter-associated beta strand protein
MAASVSRVLAFAVLFAIGASVTPARAQDATWLLNPGSNNWNTAGNWFPPMVPTGTATFDVSNTTSLNISSSASINEMLFNAGAPAYRFTIPINVTFDITGSGIVNNSSNAPTFINLFGLTFHDGSTAGNALILNGSGLSPAIVTFLDTSTAGTASIIINTSVSSNPAIVQFLGQSTAGNATIINSLDSFVAFFSTSSAGNAAISNGGALSFFNATTAGSATITNNLGGVLNFNDTSTAGSAIITNFVGGAVNFNDTSTAGNAKITNNFFLNFNNASTAGNAEINNSSLLTFNNTSTAGSATIVNNGGGAATTEFRGTSTAGNATITNDDVLIFRDTSTAGNANITNNGGLGFVDASTAGSATIINNQVINFVDASTAGNATITNNQFLNFFSTTTAGNASIFNNSTLRFFEASTAGNAIITNNSGATTFFLDNSTGGNARLIANANGTVDFSQTLGPAGDKKVSAGSIEGAGTYFLGANQLTVGSNNLNTTVSGVISDCGPSGTDCINAGATGGSLVKVGTGTLTLTGANTYTGGTTVAGGLINFNAASNFGSGTIILNGGGLQWAAGTSTDISSRLGAFGSAGATFDTNGNNVTLASVLSGPGGMTKIGAGALTLTGANTYSGATSVNAGTLFVNGSIANSAVTVNSGATLAGIGTVGPTTINSGGIFAPGTSPGTMTVQGNLAFQSGAIYLVQVNPSTASSTNVTAGGSATLAGTVQAAFASGSYAARTYTILSAAGGLNGTTFNTLTTSNLPAGFTASLSYTATDAILNLTAALGQPSGPSGPGALGTGGLTVNQLNVADALNNFFNSGGTLPPTFVTIFGLTGGNLANALSQLSGEAATGAQKVGFQLTDQFLNLMLDPFVDGRSGVGGADHPALGFAPEREDLPEDIALAYSKVLKAPPKPTPVYEPRLTVWGAGFGGSNRTSGDLAVIGSHDFSARTAGGAAGLDYRLTPDTVAGFALAGAGTNWSLSQGLGGGKSDAFQAGIYGATKSGPAYLAAAFAFANQWMSTDRLAVSDHLTADFIAQSYGGRLEGGYRFGMPYGGITPYAAIQAQYFHTPGYTETGLIPNGFALSFNGRDATDTRSELGARFDRVLAVYTNAVLALRGRVAWAHDWVSDATLVPLFQTLPGASYIVNGALPVKDSALVSAGGELRVANGVTLLAKFDGEFAGRSNTYAGTGTIRYRW